jgi:predicted RNA-binding protein associated with RNAse of E/G family
MERTTVIWHRFGKEHGEGAGFRVNARSLVDKYIKKKVAFFDGIDQSDWRWWQISDNLIIERPIITEKSVVVTKKTIIYYLIHKNWVIMENVEYPELGPGWPWYVHIGDITFHPKYNCWIMKDLFCDVVIKKNAIDHSVMDLDDLAHVIQLEMVSQKELVQTLESTQQLVNLIRNGGFPPVELEAAKYAIQKLEWDKQIDSRK